MSGKINNYNHINPIVYGDISSGYKHNREYIKQSSTPIDGSDSYLRSLSPFKIRFISPSVFDQISNFEHNSREYNIKLYDRSISKFGFYDNLLKRRDEDISYVVGETKNNPDRFNNYISRGRKVTKDNADPAFVERLSVSDSVYQLQTMRETPPLILLINPTSFSVNYEKVQQYTQRVRSGYTFQSWGENQPNLSISGSIGAYMAAGGKGSNSTTGVQFASKRDSASYQNFMNLMLFYRNNGYVYDNVGGTAAPIFVGSIAIEYDQWVYIGNFNSMNWGYESEQQNGGMVFDMEFTAHTVYDTHHPVENIMPMHEPVVQVDGGGDSEILEDGDQPIGLQLDNSPGSAPLVDGGPITGTGGFDFSDEVGGDDFFDGVVDETPEIEYDPFDFTSPLYT